MRRVDFFFPLALLNNTYIRTTNAKSLYAIVLKKKFTICNSKTNPVVNILAVSVLCVGLARVRN